jgi:hypothetical protein
VLDVLLTLDRRTNVVVMFSVDQPLEAVALGEPLDDAFSMLPRAARKVVGDAEADLSDDSS